MAGGRVAGSPQTWPAASGEHHVEVEASRGERRGRGPADVSEPARTGGPGRPWCTPIEVGAPGRGAAGLVDGIRPPLRCQPPPPSPMAVFRCPELDFRLEAQNMLDVARVLGRTGTIFGTKHGEHAGDARAASTSPPVRSSA